MGSLPGVAGRNCMKLRLMSILLLLGFVLPLLSVAQEPKGHIKNYRQVEGLKKYKYVYFFDGLVCTNCYVLRDEKNKVISVFNNECTEWMVGDDSGFKLATIFGL